ncbi:peptidoglycan bridge formation glycyltransferase FemA/FemB family protein [Mechercharimyces sp. CAU 1602]|uniref:lipid II:glycine glycyltransferase FemX n=1 Tax=Mechercharimyces sp. CAU 1602 TaxID=2973933 RepID=UPI0021622900|nr:peptidoglycan bridge formation glycyltransferase FemA/FemB family protein [Mechercharimyces sp. CAU 1602]MCS1351473.1 peptidoglycan bridge formation glycyltransferase FemA/FemB family protein [Mechercharimyces sp. CAU 1602]
MLQLAQVDQVTYQSYLKQHAASFMQAPVWAQVKPEWSSEYVGWYSQESQLVGVAMILYRKMPGLKKHLAYIPRGPVIDWNSRQLEQWFQPLFAYLLKQDAFTVKMDPPVPLAHWRAAAIEAYLDKVQEYGLRNKELRDIAMDQVDPQSEYIQQALTEMGWSRKEREEENTVQPQYTFRIPLQGRTAKQLRQGLSPSWEKNLQIASQQGVLVRSGNASDLPTFYSLLKEKAEKEGKGIREFAYFERMFRALSAESEADSPLQLAEQEGIIQAGAIKVSMGEQVWSLYAASKVNPVHLPAKVLLFWEMISDAHEKGATVFDFRSMSPVLDPATSSYDELTFLLGAGGVACEYIGEWDYPLHPMLHWAFEMYMKKR